MNRSRARLLYWAPRGLALFVAAFLGLFALDVFDEGLGFWMTIGVLLIHLAPTALVLGAAFIAWRHEWLGAAIFGALGAAYLVIGAGAVDWLAFALISGPLFVVAVLFLLNGIYRAELRQWIPAVGRRAPD